MKRTVQILVVLCMTASAAIAQQRSEKKELTGVSNTSVEYRLKYATPEYVTVRSCQELHQQLVNLFGENFDLKEKKVQDQLKKNATDKNVSEQNRKISTYLIIKENH